MKLSDLEAHRVYVEEKRARKKAEKDAKKDESTPGVVIVDGQVVVDDDHRVYTSDDTGNDVCLPPGEIFFQCGKCGGNLIHCTCEWSGEYGGYSC